MSASPLLPILPPVQEQEVDGNCTIEEPNPNGNYILYWNYVGLELNRLTHSEPIIGPQRGPPVSARALGLLHLALHDTYFSIHPPQSGTFKPYLANLPTASSATDAREAVAGAAIAMLRHLYIGTSPSRTTLLNAWINGFKQDAQGIDENSDSYKFGAAVAKLVFDKLNYEKIPDNYKPTPGRYRFGDDPTNPGKGYHEPTYGEEALAIATHIEHRIADPPGRKSAASQMAEYDDSIRDIYRMGGRSTLSTTKRTPAQAAAAYFWAYDGANLIGTPPRLYNQILRVVAFKKRVEEDITSEANNAEFARLFALVNVALADAGKYAWLAKYEFDYWRPLSGVRQDGRDGFSDPFWLSTGAPATNTNELSFKPPFPAYPSGHATFGAAAFQMMRRFYAARDRVIWGQDEPDDIGFEFTSEELNGVCRDLYKAYDPAKEITAQSGDVRTHVKRSFRSLWEAIFENAISRVWLGVHWRFDACAAKDILIPESSSPGAEFRGKVAADGTTVYKSVNDIRYTTEGTREEAAGSFPIGGVPLGLAVANDIFSNGMQPPEIAPKASDMECEL